MPMHREVIATIKPRRCWDTGRLRIYTLSITEYKCILQKPSELFLMGSLWEEAMIKSGKLINKVLPVPNGITTNKSISICGPVRKLPTHIFPREVTNKGIKEYGYRIIGKHVRLWISVKLLPRLSVF